MKTDQENSIISPQESPDDQLFDGTLRPQNLDEYIGQNGAKENLKIFMTAAKNRNEPLEHVLIFGPPGLGKTTLAHIIAHEMGKNIKITSGPAIERTGDLAAILTNLSEGDILFIDEIHRLNKTIEEVLYPAMEDYALDIIIGKGPSARTLRLNLPKFTLVGATTKVSGLSSPLRDRFGNIYRLNFYALEEIGQIIKRAAKILKIDKGTLKVGQDADITIVDADKEWIVDKNSVCSKSKNSAFLGRKLSGLVEYTIYSGKIVHGIYC